MVSLLGLPSAIQQPEGLKAFGDILTPDETRRLASLAERMIVLISPLTELGSWSVLEELLEKLSPPWVGLANEVINILFADRSDVDLYALKKLIEQSSNDLADVGKEQADLLGEVPLEQFLGALVSLQSLSNWAFEAYQKGGAEAHRFGMLSPLVAEHALRAQLCIIAVVAILLGKEPNWILEAIPILCVAADDHMTQVEDAFLSLASPRTAGTQSEEDLVDYEQLRRSLELSA